MVAQQQQQQHMATLAWQQQPPPNEASKASNLLPCYFKYDAGNNQSKMPRTFGGDGVPPLTDKPGTPKIRLGKQMVMRWGAININGGYSGKKVELAEAASKMGLDVLAVSDIWVRGEEQEEVGEYKVYLSGVKAGIAQWGVGLYIRKEMEPSVVAIRYVNERLMWIDLTVSSKKIRIVSVYSHCEGTDQDKMDSFYEALSDVVVRVKDKDSVLLMGDFNARIGNQTEGYEKVMGKFGEDMEATRNGKQLLDFCARYGQEELSQQLRQLSQQVRHHPVSFSACSIFNVDSGLLTGFVATVVTHAIILLQFGASPSADSAF
ncbi:craniofacial development protein 2-like [Schistocerca cancellata]|uniref:craniofacial development protein 2-like n=1 Tax=Schistocerca cancellata TaxID=274614 RepID=UPI002117336F|nr:craniofacial development protein 2-like [Schistocerca cancellata]